MNSQRAKEIVSSPIMFNVTYNGSGIYMENVNDSNNTCTIHYLNNPQQRMDVTLSILTEHL